MAESKGGELTKEQLLDYVKKQKIKLKKLETVHQKLVEEFDTYKRDQPTGDAKGAYDAASNDLSIEVESLVQQLDAKSGEQFELRRESSASRQLAESLQQQLEALQADHDSVLGEKSALQSRVVTLEEELVSLSKSCFEHHGQECARLEAEHLSFVKAAAAKHDKQMAVLQSSVQELTASKGALQKELAGLADKLSEADVDEQLKMHNQLLSAEKDRAECEAVGKESQKENSRLNARIVELESDIQQMMTDRAEMENRCTEASSEKDSHQAKTVEMVDVLSKLRDAMDKQQTELSEFRGKAEADKSTIDSLTEMLKDKDADVARLEGELAAAAAATESAVESIAALEARLESESERQAAGAAAEAAKQEEAAASSSQSELEQQREREKLREEISGLRGQLSELQADLTSSSTERESLTEMLKGKDADVARLEGELAAAVTASESALEELRQQSESDCAAHVSSIAALEARLEVLKENQAAGAAAEAAKQEEAAASSSQSELEQQREREELLSQLREEISGLRGQLSELQADRDALLSSSSTERESLGECLKGKDADIVRLEGELAAAAAAVTASESVVEELRKSESDCAAHVSSIAALEARLESESERQVAGAAAEAAKQEEEAASSAQSELELSQLHKEISGLRGQLSELQAVLTSSSTERESLTERLRDKDADIARLEGELAAAAKSIKIFESALDDCAAYATTIHDLETRLESESDRLAACCAARAAKQQEEVASSMELEVNQQREQDELREEISGLRGQLSELQADRDALLTSSSTERESLGEILKGKDADVARLEGELAAAVTASESALEELRQQSESECAAHVSSIAALEVRLESESERQAAGAAAEAAKQEEAAASSSQSELEQQREREELLSQLREEISGLRGQLSELQADLASSSTERESLTEMLNGKDADIVRLEGELAAAAAAVTASESVVEALRKSESDCAAHVSSIAALEVRLESESERQAAGAAAEAAKQEEAAASSSQSELELSQLREEISGLRGQLSELQADHDALISRSATERESLGECLKGKDADDARGVISLVSAAAASEADAESQRESREAAAASALQLSALVEELKAAKAELEKRVTEVSEKNHKLSNMVKSKMREIDAQKKQLSALQDGKASPVVGAADAGDSSAALASASAAVKKLNKEIESYKKSIADLTKSVADGAAQAKSAGEEAAAAREELEEYRQRVLQLEGQLEQLEGQSAEGQSAARGSPDKAGFRPIDAADAASAGAGEAELAAIREDLKLVSSVVSALLSSNSSPEPRSDAYMESKEMKPLYANIVRVVSKVRGMAASSAEALAERAAAEAKLEQATQAREGDVQMQETKLNAFAEKVKRMKLLLTKSQAAAAEKDVEIAQLKECKVSVDRMGSFSVGLRLHLPPCGSGSGSSDDSWCLVLDSAASGGGSAAPPKWVTESTAREWVEEGSRLQSLETSTADLLRQALFSSAAEGDSWSESGEAKHLFPTPVSELVAAELRRVQEPLRREVEGVQAELANTMQMFQAYKSKAQLALKKMGQGDKSEWQKQRQDDERTIESLRRQLDELGVQLENVSQDLNIAESSVEAVESERDGLSARLNELEKAIEFEQQKAVEQEKLLVTMKKNLEEETALRKSAAEESSRAKEQERHSGLNSIIGGGSDKEEAEAELVDVSMDGTIHMVDSPPGSPDKPKPKPQGQGQGQGRAGFQRSDSGQAGSPREASLSSSQVSKCSIVQ
jgi:chromosome segregation ATPase